ncbi:hypothetical protein C3Y87_02920 [Carbonactinospora thermoautotrophica]|uniref:hypothetical protein n=1 Tax=Carbonactinospora thermoautotrophica TaxID=1469144 RepID=UPI00226E6106|nr:hypothetical protein [Carbonactinospora thermoautotrophica]MCX9190384.1 hypothetical protein [Carbonactinospora thermoautotrophica]
MAYRIIFDPQADAVRKTLPLAAKVALRALLAALVRDPTVVGRSVGGNPFHRSASFGKHGLVFYFDDMRQTITIKEIIWAK